VQSASALRFDVSWAAIILASIAGIVLYLAIIAIERAVIPWHATVRSQEP
jgi:ABC-type nitrate/sulfonate/bicarbonate transport system permease component